MEKAGWEAAIVACKLLQHSSSHHLGKEPAAAESNAASSGTYRPSTAAAPYNKLLLGPLGSLL